MKINEIYEQVARVRITLAQVEGTEAEGRVREELARTVREANRKLVALGWKPIRDDKKGVGLYGFRRSR